ncbi:9759_t:CDS:2 [Dentiscutata heterogama]|uniref:9759_t:CDS:1 n=1 Tax=Dentiscutata heterogama TaxID=1316150 RepID=A0ACA9M584_9GLOM|nr:9759_t:CDS:2 [Dentiscutata heterogama]
MDQNNAKFELCPSTQSFQQPRAQNYIRQEMQFATREMIDSTLAPTKTGVPNWKYSLNIVQTSERARMCGFGEKDRRSLSPLPIVQLLVSDETGKPVDIDDIEYNFFVLHATPYKCGTREEASLVIHPTSQLGFKSQTNTRNLLGNLIANGRKLKDHEGRLGIFFVYQDLSIRTDGDFYFEFNLMYIGFLSYKSQGMVNTGLHPMSVLASVESSPFVAYSAKKFPGMIETTSLSRAFSSQGVKIATRSDKKGRTTSKNE